MPTPPPPVTIPNCNTLPSEYNSSQQIQNCSIPNANGSKYNCAVTGGQNWACAINPQNYVCSGIICSVEAPSPNAIPKCNTLPPAYNVMQQMQNCSIPNLNNKYNCAVTGNQNWACGIPQNYSCTGVICDAS
jgi:hypothetical protein